MTHSIPGPPHREKSLSLPALGSMLALLFILMLTACGAPSHGTVVRRSWTPAHTDVMYHCMAYNTKGWCTLNIPVYYPIPDRWELYITDPKDGDGWVDVTKDEYDRAQQGMHWSENGGLTS